MSSPSTINSQPLVAPKSHEGGSTNLPLITLHDGRPGLRRGLHAQVREPSPTQDVGLKTQGCGLRTQDSPSPPSTPDTRHSLAAPKSYEGGSPVLDFIASSEALDRYNEIISADGWRLDNYRRNPVFQNAHQYGDIIFTLGKALITEVRAGKLFQRVEFATEINPMAKIAYGLYKGKFLNAVSVGFIPLKWEDAPASSGPSTINSPTLNSSSPRRRYLEQELLEVSAVGIPANPEALQLGLKAGAIEKRDLKDLLELIRMICESGRHSREAEKTDPSPRPSPLEKGRGSSATGGHALAGSDARRAEKDARSRIEEFSGNPAASNTHACAPGVRSYEAQLLQLARALRDVLRR